MLLRDRFLKSKKDADEKRRLQELRDKELISKADVLKERIMGRRKTKKNVSRLAEAGMKALVSNRVRLIMILQERLGLFQGKMVLRNREILEMQHSIIRNQKLIKSAEENLKNRRAALMSFERHNILIHDIITGRCLVTLHGHTGSVSALQYVFRVFRVFEIRNLTIAHNSRYDKNFILSGSLDGTMRRWPIRRSRSNKKGEKIKDKIPPKIKYHIVERGDTLSTVAKHYEIDVKHIRFWNAL